MKIHTLAETMTVSINDRENAVQRDQWVEVHKPETDAATLRKFKIFCFIQMTMVILSYVTFGVLIHTLMKRVDATETKSDDLQAKINRLQSTAGASVETDPSASNLDARISQLEIDREKDQKHIEVIHGTMAHLTSDIVANRATFQSQNSSIENLEKVQTSVEIIIQDQTSRLSEIEIENNVKLSSFDTLNTSLLELESKLVTESVMVNSLNSTLVQLEKNLTSHFSIIVDQNSQIRLLEENMAASRTMMGIHNSSIGMLESNLTAQMFSIKNHTSRLDQQETDILSDRTAMETLTNNMSMLESDITIHIATINDHSSSLAELKRDWTSHQVILEMHNTSLMRFDANLTSQATTIYNLTLSLIQVTADMESDRDAIQNLSSRVSVMETNMQTDISTMEANSGRLSQLEIYKNETNDFHRALDSRLTYLEDGLNCTWSNWTPFSTCTGSVCAEGAEGADGTRYRERVCESLNPEFTGMWCSRKETEIEGCNCAGDCSEVRAASIVSGIYTIYPNRSSDEAVSVFCEFDAEGAWTVLQRRIDGTVDFYRYWSDYKEGFGSTSAEHWIGNDVIHKITTRESYKLKIRLTDWSGETRYATYSTFRVADESDGYRLNVDGFSGDTGDALMVNNGRKFSTRDVDNDKMSSDHCAVSFQGAFWYDQCSRSNLNGLYYPSPSVPDGDYGIYWLYWHDTTYSLKATIMMIQKN